MRREIIQIGELYDIIEESKEIKEEMKNINIEDL